MLPVQSQDLEGLVNLNSILILDVDWWSASYLRNILAQGGSAHITTKQGNKTLPPELWLNIIDRVESYVDGNTYKPVYCVEMTPGSMDGSGTESALVCNVLEEWTKCGDLTDGNRINAYEKCLHDPSYKLDPEKDWIDEKEKYYFIITKTVEKNSYSIPVSHLRLKGDFLFRNIEVPDMIARCEGGECSLCGGERYIDSGRPAGYEEFLMFCNEVEFHRRCYWHGVVCPLCIGGGYADAYLEILRSGCRNYDYDDDEEEEETEEEISEKKRIRDWLWERYQELGYGQSSYRFNS